MFPYHRKNQPFYIQFSCDSDPQCAVPHNLDFAAGDTSIDVPTGFQLPRDEVSAGGPSHKAVTIEDDPPDDGRKKKHRDIERLRRKEMATLYSKLRSLLPSEYVKGKRSVSDLMNEARNYIKDLENNIEELGVTRDQLNKFSNRNVCSESSKSSLNFVEVGPWFDGAEIIISRCIVPEECLLLSVILEALVHEGLNVVSWISNRESHRMIYTIHCEAGGTTMLDLTRLKLRLNELVPCWIMRQDV